MADPDSNSASPDPREKLALNPDMADTQTGDHKDDDKRETGPSPENVKSSSSTGPEGCGLNIADVRRKWDYIGQIDKARQAAAPPRKRPSTPKKILDHELDRYDHKVWGFKIYRLTYEDDAKWQAFMEELDRQARSNLERGLDGADRERLVSTLDWAVENDKSKWGGASFGDVRKHFKQLCDEEKPKYSHVVRYKVCLVVDLETLESAFHDGKFRVEETYSLHQSPFVKALNGEFNEEEALMERLKGEYAHHARLRQHQDNGEEIKDMDWVYKSAYPPDPVEVEYLKVPLKMVIPALYYDLFNSGFEDACEIGAVPPKLWII